MPSISKKGNQMKVDPDTGEIPEPRPFAEFLDEQRSGLTHSELTTGFRQLIDAVQTYNKKGSLTFTVKVEPAGDGKVSVTDVVKIKAPEPDRSMSIFYVDDGANLQRDNPRQQKLDLRNVAQAPANIREIK